MAHWYARGILLLYTVAAASCGDDDAAVGGAGRGGVGGQGGGGRGGISGQGGVGGRGVGGRGGAASDCQPADPAEPVRAPNGRTCEGGTLDNFVVCSRRVVSTQCYVVADDGPAADCLPPDDPTALTLVRDYIGSVGFLSEFIVDSAPTMALPETCDSAIACCDALAQRDQQRECYGRIDDVSAAVGRVCDDSQSRNSFEKQFDCAVSDSDAGPEASGGDAGTSQGHRLCCYRVCGHLHWT